MPKYEVSEKFLDQNTGETVTRVKIDEKLLPEIEKHINANALSANNFMGVSRQIVAMQIKQREEFDKAQNSEKEIGKAIIRTREKIGLDSSWVYNIGLKVMEKRDPPPETRTIPAPEVITPEIIK